MVELTNWSIKCWQRYSYKLRWIRIRHKCLIFLWKWLYFTDLYHCHF